jgi:hypothetical protein
MRNNRQDPQSPGAQPGGKSLGMGGEAVEGFHALQQESAPADAGSQQNTAATGRGDAGDGADRAGSEPLGHRREHVPSYGGLGGVPRVSSDQREPADPEGDANVGGAGRTAAHGEPGGQADESDPPYPTPT